ncbi:hypothetical protein V22_15220 [Calycomorphotria hydatis]|uniref:DUF368 domain-containing protein n=2 Tax=Calycomorphotria hydatis TaxID=2528027 RepID=A0A517T7G7_9PLAN|nr:hypothetical protein V22_15220 [Calycomorphotria hydatis]
MGGADIIPGVSGGTVALILGIYERLVTAVSRVDRHLLQLVMQGRILEIVRYLDLALLVPLLIGIGVGGLSLAGVMEYLLHHQLQLTFATFFGLILGSTILVARMIPKWTGGFVGIMAGFAIIAFVVVGLPVLHHPPENAAYLFLCGAIAITAMILPGISGSYLLLVLGAYERILGLINGLKRGEFGIEALTALGAFGAGVVIGILAFSKVLKWLLAHYRDWTLAALTGLMIGSLRRLWPFQTDLTPEVEKFGHKQFEAHLPDFAAMETWLAIGCGLIGLGAILLLDWVVSRKGDTPTGKADAGA